ncbi:hypothetical protein HanIR_Chr11g0534831 [Helianthus annuus]|nr:hypothetical protein HanIR_Chr11g0534831 [Helianthus annuus]
MWLQVVGLFHEKTGNKTHKVYEIHSRWRIIQIQGVNFNTLFNEAMNNEHVQNEEEVIQVALHEFIDIWVQRI